MSNQEEKLTNEQLQLIADLKRIAAKYDIWIITSASVRTTPIELLRSADMVISSENDTVFVAKNRHGARGPIRFASDYGMTSASLERKLMSLYVKTTTE